QGEEPLQRYYERLERIFGREIRELMEGMLNGTIDIENATINLGNSAGTVFQKWAKEAQKPGEEMRELKRQVSDLWTQIGEFPLHAIGSLNDFIEKLRIIKALLSGDFKEFGRLISGDLWKNQRRAWEQARKADEAAGKTYTPTLMEQYYRKFVEGQG